MENIGVCFEVDEFSETLQIPVELIKKVGIFEFMVDGDRRASIRSTPSKSFLQFSCALSLCLNGGDLQYELSEVKERSSYIAVVLHMAGFLSAMANSSSVLNTLKQLCGKQGDQERRRSLHAVFESITSRGIRIFALEGIEVHITLTSGEKIKTNSKVTNLLVQVMRGSGEKVNLSLKRVILPRVNEDEWDEIESVLNFIELLQTKFEEERIEVVNKNNDFQFLSLKFATDSDYIRLCAFFGAIQGWTLDFLDLDTEKKEVSKIIFLNFLLQVLKMLVFLAERARVEAVKITKSSHNICVAWGLKEARWSLRRVKKDRAAVPLVQQQGAAIGTKLEFNLERGLRQVSSTESSEKERENSEENKSITESKFYIS